MTCKVGAVFAMFLSVAFLLVFNQAFAQSGPAHHGGSFGAKHSPHHRFPHHIHHRRNMGFFPAIGGFWGVPNDGFGVDVYAPTYAPTFDATRYTCTYDIPWDWVHRCPPVAAYTDPDSPSVPVVRRPGCVNQVVTVPGADGKDQTVTMLRC